MSSLRLLPIVSLSIFARTSTAQALSWCKDDSCGDCPSSLATLGPGGPDACVIYDSNTVFGGYGYKEGVEKIKYLVRGNFPEPCGGGPGSIFVRSPASLEAIGCGNLRYTTEQAECSVELPIEDTFMISFCRGYGDCEKLGIPVSPSAFDTQASSASTGLQGLFLQWPNGSIIEPLAIGSPPEQGAQTRGTDRARRQVCRGCKADSYQAAKEPYFATFETQIVSSSVQASPGEPTVSITYDQSVSETTSFDTSVGDPLGIVSVSVGFSFEKSETKGFQVNVPIREGQSGRVGFTPVYRCTEGTLETCDGARTPQQRSCTPYVLNGIVQGDHAVILS